MTIRRRIVCLVLACAVVIAATGAERLSPATAAGRLQVIASVGGQPDDIAVDNKGRLVWGNLANGTVDRLVHGRVKIVARDVSVPEGIVVLPHGALIVAAQGQDRLVKITPKGRRSIFWTLRPVAGQEGVDGIGRDSKNGDILVPDSPHGTALRVTANGRKSRVIATGLGRPVDAAMDKRGNVLVPDEHLGTLVAIAPNGHVSYRGSLSTPDDLAVDRQGRVWVTTLGDNALWLLAPGAAPRRVLTGLAQPQGLTLDKCGDPIIVEQNLGRIVRLLLTRRSSRCAY